MRKESDSGEFRNSRPISDYSGSEFDHQVNVKKREFKPAKLIQVRKKKFFFVDLLTSPDPSPPLCVNSVENFFFFL